MPKSLGFEQHWRVLKDLDHTYSIHRVIRLENKVYALYLYLCPSWFAIFSQLKAYLVNKSDFVVTFTYIILHSLIGMVAFFFFFSGASIVYLDP